MKFLMKSAAIIGALSFIIASAPVTAGGKNTTTSGASSQSAQFDPETGQPGVECEDVRPGQAASAPGSAFNEEGKAGTVYAGEQPQNSKNTASVSQYDVACIKQP
jgi:type IV secretory pathway TrbL component